MISQGIADFMPVNLRTHIEEGNVIRKSTQSFVNYSSWSQDTILL